MLNTILPRQGSGQLNRQGISSNESIESDRIIFFLSKTVNAGKR